MSFGLLVSAAAALDLAAAPALDASRQPATSPAWVRSCVSAIERARDEYSRRRHRLVDVRVTTQLGVKDDRHGECGRHVVDRVAFEVPTPRNKYDLPVYSGSIQSRSGVDDEHSQPWTRRGWATESYSYERHDSGRTAETSVLDQTAPDAAEFSLVFQHALDECFARAPASPRPPPEPTADELRTQCSRDAPSASFPACKDAELAADELERTCIVEGGAVGYAGRPGTTEPALHRITALGTPATPILMRLARSTNPAARAVAAMGFGEIKTDVARAELRRLASDQTIADTINGCIGSGEAVSQFAKRALAR